MECKVLKLKTYPADKILHLITANLSPQSVSRIVKTILGVKWSEAGVVYGMLPFFEVIFQKL